MKQDHGHEGFKVLLRECLQADSDDHVLVIFDEGFHKLQEALVDVACDLDLSVTFIYIPRRYQELLVRKMEEDSKKSKSVPLPSGLVSAITDSTIIINDLDSGPVRRTILNEQRRRDCRLAHTPGLSREILEILTVSPIPEISSDCELVAWALGEAESAELKTWDGKDREYVLNMDLGGWRNEPLMSPGVIASDSWGNVPPGEAFCCPEHLGVHGQICINGSIPGVPLRGGEEVVLTFEAGKLINWDAGACNQADQYFQHRLTESRRSGDANWNTFAELGIGLNPAIKSLTGNPLFDEKAYGTIHVAIGDNASFGHAIKSFIHDDLVACLVDLSLDGTKVISRGDLQRDAIFKRRVSQQIPPLGTGSIEKFSLVDARLEVLSNGLVRRCLRRAGRKGNVRMVRGKVERLLSAFVRSLPKDEWISIDALTEQLPDELHDPEVIGQMLAVLDHYQAVTIVTT